MKRFQIDLRLAGAAVLALVTGLGIHAVTRPPATVGVLVAAEDLAPGIPLSQLSTEIREFPEYPGLLTGVAAESLGDHVLSTRLAAGDPLLASLLIPRRGTRPDIAAITLSLEHAVQGDLAAGDLVDIYVTTTEATSLLAEDVLIVSAVSTGDGFGSGEVALLVAVDPRLASLLLEAANGSALDLVRKAR